MSGGYAEDNVFLPIFVDNVQSKVILTKKQFEIFSETTGPNSIKTCCDDPPVVLF